MQILNKKLIESDAGRKEREKKGERERERKDDREKQGEIYTERGGGGERERERERERGKVDLLAVTINKYWFKAFRNQGIEKMLAMTGDWYIALEECPFHREGEENMCKIIPKNNFYIIDTDTYTYTYVYMHLY